MTLYRLVLSSAVFLLSGCVPAPRPLLAGNPLPPLQVATLASLVRGQASSIHSYRYLARTELTESGEHARLRYAVVAEPPKKLRIEVLPTNAAFTLQLLVANGEQVTFLDSSEHQALTSDNPAGAVSRLIGVAIDQAELAYLLIGRVPPYAEGALDGFRPKEGEGVLLSNHDRTRIYRIEESSGRLLEAALFDQSSDRLVAHFRYQGSMQGDEAPLPSQIEVILPRNNLTLALTLPSVTLNTPVSEALFTVTIPRDYSVHTHMSDHLGN